MRTRFLRFSLLLMVVGLSAASFARPAFAEQPAPIRLGISPVEYQGQYFDLTMSPGESRLLKVQLVNDGTEKIAARTYAADAYSIINGGFGARLDGEATSGTTLWLSYPADTIDLPSGEGLARSFSVAVPASAGPGEYITSLVVQNAEPTEAQGGGVAIKQIQRTVIAVVVTVPGERKPALVIGEVAHKYVATRSVISATVSNTGNVRLKPAGEMVVSDSRGAELKRIPFRMDSVYTGDTTSLEVPFEEALLAGGYRVTLNLSHEGGAVSAVEVPLNVPAPTDAEISGAPTGAVVTADGSQGQPAGQPESPPRLLVIGSAVALVLMLAIAGVWLRKRSSTPRSGNPGEREATAGTTATDLLVFPARRQPVREIAPAPPARLREPLAKAAGQSEMPPLRPRAWGLPETETPARASVSVQPQELPVFRIGRFSGQKAGEAAERGNA